MNLALHNLKKINPSRWLKYLPMGTAILLLLLLIASIFFLYRYFYQTVAEVKTVAILKSQVALSQVDLPLYQKVFSAWENKKKFDPASLENINDPFRSLPPAPPPANAPTLESANTPPAPGTTPQTQPPAPPTPAKK